MIQSLIPHDPPRRDLNAAYQLRVRFWITSVCAHIVWVAVTLQIPLSAPASKRPIYDQFIRPLESKVLIYRPPKKPEQAAPEKQVGESKEALGKIVAPRTVIATAKDAQSQKQIVWKPANVPEVSMDVPAPTVVARVETALPPPPPKVAPKQFTPPQPAKSNPTLSPTEIAATLTAAPSVAIAQPNPAVANTLLAPPPKVAPKQFTPPPPSQQPPQLPTRTEVNETLTAASPLTVAQAGLVTPAANLPPPPKVAPKQFVPPAATGGTPKQPSRTEVTETLAALPQVNGGPASNAVPSITFSRVPGPPKDAPTAPEATRGNQQVNLAVASVNPAPAAEVPTKARSGQFSVAPKLGEPSSGEAAAGALTVPNLTAHDLGLLPQPSSGKSNTVVYTERVRPSYSSVFTVPLRPSNRSIPKSVEAHFTGRNVYAVVIPIENLPAYGTDWILWFSETTPPSGLAPSVRPPIPFRKIELVEKGREARDTRLQIAATLSMDGKLSNIKVLSAVPESVQALAIEDLSAWEWKPATRSNAAVAIEAVFEIPFRLALRP
jgi:hypothetical protein